MLNYFKKKPKPIIHNEIIDYIQYHHILKITLIWHVKQEKINLVMKCQKYTILEMENLCHMKHF